MTNCVNSLRVTSVDGCTLITVIPISGGYGTGATGQTGATGLTGLVGPTGPMGSTAPIGNLTGDVTSTGLNTTANPDGQIVTLTGIQPLANKTITGSTNNVDATSLRATSVWVAPIGGTAPIDGQVLTYNTGTLSFQAPTPTYEEYNFTTPFTGPNTAPNVKISQNR